MPPHGARSRLILARGNFSAMTETPTSVSPAPGLPPQPPVLLPIEDVAQLARRQGCLKWGLIGCAGASVAVIIGLLFLMNNAKKLMAFAAGRSIPHHRQRGQGTPPSLCSSASALAIAMFVPRRQAARREEKPR